MDVYTFVLWVLMALLIGVLAAGLYVLALYAWKQIDHGWTALVGLIPYHLSEPPASDYFGKRHAADSYSLGSFPTADDLQLKNLASKIAAKGGSKKHQARIALAMVQQYVRYVKDKDQYGQNELWVLPWQTVARKKGDCEDSAFLLAGLLYNLGIGAVVAEVPGHMTVGADLGRKSGLGFTVAGKFYTLLEPTGFLPVFGLYSVSGTKVRHIQEVQIPDAGWKSGLFYV